MTFVFFCTQIHSVLHKVRLQMEKKLQRIKIILKTQLKLK